MKHILLIALLSSPAFGQTELGSSGELDAGPTAIANAQFGSALAAEQDWLVAGATQTVPNLPGEIQLFRRVGGSVFTLEAVATGAANSDAFGAAVAIDVDAGVPVVLVGAPENDQDQPDGGRASLFEFVGGALQLVADLAPGDPVASAGFGAAVATDASVYAVGRPGSGAGSVYLFDGTVPGIGSLPQATPFDGANGDQFGAALALDSGLLAVGAPLGDAVGVDSGAVYLFEQASVGTPFQALVPLSNAKLVGAGVASGHQFGRSVALDGDLLVVGAPFDGSGAAYVFRRQPGGGFVQEQRLTAPALGPVAQFGTSVAIEGDSIVVGAPVAFTTEGVTGAMVVFEQSAPSSWDPIWTAVISDVGGNAFIGTAVGLAGDLAFAGAPGAPVLATPVTLLGAGLVGVFDVDGGTCLVDLVTPPTVTSSDRVGASVAANLDLVVIGSPRDDSAGGDAGSVASFVRSGSFLTHAASIPSPSGLVDRRFGAAVDVDPTTLVVGAPAAPELPFLGGAAYVYSNDGGGRFGPAEELTNPGSAGTDRFGAAVVLDGDRVLVGGPGIDGGRGAALAYVRPSTASPFALRQTLTPREAGSVSDSFGAALAAADGRAAVGVPGDDLLGPDKGAVELLESRPLVLGEFALIDEADPLVAPLVDADALIGGGGIVQLTDLDGNGVEDLAVGLPFDDSVVLDGGSVVILRLGGDGSVIAASKLTDAPGLWSGLEPGDLFGTALAYGDFDGDGLDELAVGAASGDSPGIADGGDLWLVDLDANGSAVAASQLSVGSLPGPAPAGGASFGSSVQSIGDVDGNGVDDLVVGAPFDQDGAAVTGAVRVILMGMGGTVLQVTRYLPSDLGLPSYAPTVGRFGTELAFEQAGGPLGEDVLFVGDSSNTVGGVSFGAVVALEVQSGGALLARSLISPQVQALSGFDTGDLFGFALASPGDLDGNGVADLITSRPSAEVDGVAGVDVGLLLVVLLDTDWSPLDAYVLAPDQPGLVPLQDSDLLFGNDLRWLGDIDQDGAVELAVGAPKAGDLGPFDALLLFEVSPGYLLRQDPLRSPGVSDGARLGTSVAMDGLTLVAGAPGDSSQELLSGSVSVFEGPAGSATLSQVLTPSTPAKFLAFGSSVDLAGNTLHVGAPGNIAGAGEVGRVYRFERIGPGSPFVETAVLDGDGLGGPGDAFGAALATTGTALLVGAPGVQASGPLSGAVFDFSSSGDCPTALGSTDFLSLAEGGAHTILVAPGPTFANLPYLVATSLAPGITPLPGGLLLPIAPDALFSLSVTAPNLAPFVDSFGFLDADGRAVSQVALPPGLPASLVGLRLYSAYLVLSLLPPQPIFASDAVQVELVP